MKKIIIVGILISLIFSCKQLDEFITDPTETAELTVVNNTKHNITLNLGEFASIDNTVSKYKTAVIESGSSFLLKGIKLDDYNGWFTYTSGGINYTMTLSDRYGLDLFNFSFSNSAVYELILEETIFEFIKDNIVLNTTNDDTTNSDNTEEPGLQGSKLTIKNNSLDNNITIHIGNFLTKEKIMSSDTISLGSTLDLYNLPLNEKVNIWYTYTSLNTNYTIELISTLTGSTFEFTFQDNKNYELELLTTTFKFLDDGVDVNSKTVHFYPRVTYDHLTSSNPAVLEYDLLTPITELNKEMFTVSNGEITDISTEDNTIYLVSVTPNSDGLINVVLNRDQVINDKGEYNSEVDRSFTYDGTAPVIEINPLEDFNTFYDQMKFEMIVSEYVDTFSPSSRFSVTNGKVANITRDSDYSGVGERHIVTVEGESSGDVSLTAIEGKFPDDAGNANSETTSTGSYTYTSIGIVKDIAPSSDPNWAYAIDYERKQMVKLDLLNEKIDSVLTLPHPNPVSMKYSSSEKVIYIAYRYRDIISRFSTETESFLTDLNFSSDSNNSEIVEIEIMETNNQLYILSPRGSYGGYITIVNISNGNTIATGSVDGQLLAVSQQTGEFFIGDVGTSPSGIAKFSVTGKNITEIAEIWDMGGNGQAITISPDGNHLVFSAGGGNGTGYTMFDIDPSDINSKFGEWNVGAYPELAIFSHDNRYLYALGDGLKIFDMDYTELKEYDFDTFDYHLFNLNIDSTILINFTYDTYYKNKQRFEFYKNIRP